MSDRKREGSDASKKEAEHYENVENLTDVGGAINASGEMTAWTGMTDDAKAATDTEHKLTLWQAVKIYRKAVMWSMIVSGGIVMDGYDTALIGSLFAYPSFQKKFGEPYNGGYQVAANWQIALGLSATVGNIVGIFINGWLSDKFGHKKVMIASYILMAGFIFVPFFAPNVQVLFVGEILCGIPWGVFSTMAPAYASEVCPVILRGYLATFVVLCWGIGQLIAAGVLDGLEGSASEWAYRIPFGLQWIWPAILFVPICLSPESPWHLVRKGRLLEAERSLKRLSRKSATDVDAKQTVAMMVHTNNLEREITAGATYWDCFKGTNLRRTEISCAAWSIQVWASFVIMSYATYFYEQAGLQASSAYKMTVGQGGLHFLCTMCSVFLTGNLGRRTIYFYGLCCMTSLMFVIGFLALAPTSIAIAWAQSAIYLLWFCGYELTIGPVAYIIVSETSSTRLRQKTVALSRNAYNIASVLNYIVAPYILNPTEGNWKGKAGFLAGGLSLISTIWTFYRLPECKGRTYEELDLLFERNVPARKFKRYIVNAYDADRALIDKKEYNN